MKNNKKLLLGLLFIILSAGSIQAQYGYGNGYGRGGYGRNRSAVPQVQETPEKVVPPTAEEIVEKEMPAIKEALDLNPFEEAVVSSILTKSIQKRIELGILQLSPEKTKEAYQKIYETQKEELQAGLPKEKYDAFVKLQEDGLKKVKKNKKKEKKKKSKDEK